MLRLTFCLLLTLLVSPAFSQEVRYFTRNFQSVVNGRTPQERRYFVEGDTMRLEDYHNGKLIQKSMVTGTQALEEADAYLWYIWNPMEYFQKPFFHKLKASVTRLKENGKPSYEKFAQGIRLTFGQAWNTQDVPYLTRGSGQEVYLSKDKLEETHTIFQDSLLVSAFTYRKKQRDTLYIKVDKMAAPKAGLAAFTNQLANTIQYPKSAIEQDREAAVYIQFTVDEKGKLQDFTTLNQEDFEFDKKALEKLKAYPSWNPAQLNGRPVKTRYNLPIIFRLE